MDAPLEEFCIKNYGGWGCVFLGNTSKRCPFDCKRNGLNKGCLGYRLREMIKGINK